MENYSDYLTQHLTDIIENAPFPIGVYSGRDMKVVLANKSLKRTWGKGDDVIGKSYMDVLPELAGHGIYEKLWEVLDTGIPYHTKNSRVDLVMDGELKTHYFNYSFTPLLDKSGNVYGVMNTAADVSDINISRQHLHIAENKLKLAIESADLGTYETDLISEDVLTSERFNDIWNITPPANRSMVVDKILPEDKEVRLAAHQKALETDGKVHYEARIKADDSIVRWVRVKGNIQFDHEGKPVSLLGIAQDITAEKEFASYLASLVEEKTAELNRSNQDLTHFAHVVSHDLKEPIRKIKMFNSRMLESLAEGDLKRVEQFGNKISLAADSMVNLVNGILTYSEVSNQESVFEMADLGEILDSAIADLDMVIEAKRAVIHKDTLPVVEGIPVLLKQLFYNLLSNALKFSHPERTPMISIFAFPHTTNGSDCMAITVSDNGVGIEEKYVDDIFKPFLRLHSKNKYEGNGLGLSLCKRIVERHNGTIEAVSRPSGAEFVICLPLKQTDHNIPLPFHGDHV